MPMIRRGGVERFVRRAALVLLTLVPACHDGARDQLIANPDPPRIIAASVAANPQNVLGVVVLASTSLADSVAVRYHLAGETADHDSVTPSVPAEADASVPVLGLLPDSRYVLRPMAFGAGGTVTGDSLEWQTDSLPSDLPRFTASGPAPSPGYLVFAAGRYGLVIDNTGRVVWYRRFSSGPGLAFMAQPNGHYVTRLPTPDPTDREPWVEFDVLGDVKRSLSCAGGLQSRPHDLIAEPDGSWWILCDETRAWDLSGVGGLAGAQVTGTVVQHLSGNGSLLFQWSPFDHFAITDLAAADRVGLNVNWTHGNALDIAPDGNLLVSFRSLNEITKIDVASGDVLWRLGGLRNEFTFADSSQPKFVHQHGLRRCASGALLLLDNLGDPSESRAERYVLDETAMTAQLVRAYATQPGVITQIGGSTQDLPEGHTLVSFGTAGRVEEYDASGQVVWRIEGNAGYVFRAQRIHSLYAPGVGSPR